MYGPALGNLGALSFPEQRQYNRLRDVVTGSKSQIGLRYSYVLGRDPPRILRKASTARVLPSNARLSRPSRCP